MLQEIELYILLFFTYSFAGWLMESVGGILKVKKFVNRGFLIGPYCPVYGVGVVIITILLNGYTDDIPVLFVLSTVICGTLEYLTSYVMEKLFNARWWDYKNRKFNINGRICLETLLPFGIAGSVILCIINPFFENIYLSIPDLYRHTITIVLCSAFAIDFIISFRIILSFKGEIYSSRDNTEEIGEKVKDKTEEALMKASSNVIVFGRRLKLKELKFQRKVKYTRKNVSTTILETPRELAEKINKQRIAFNNKIVEEKEKISSKIKQKRAEYELKQKEQKQIVSSIVKNKKELFEEISKNKIDNTMKNIKLTSEEFTKQVRANFKKKSILRNRLMNAFPSLEIKNLKDKKNKK